MPRFRYRARADSGQSVEGFIEAVSADAVASQLSSSGAIPIEIEETREKDASLQSLERLLRERRPSLPDLILFSRQMYTLNRAGVPIIRAMNGLAESTRNPVLSRTLRDLVESLESGRELATSMARHPKVFSSLFVSIVQVGEQSGRLEEAFLQISQYLELEQDTRDRIKSATRYPSFVLIAIVIAVGIINIMVIPAFAGVFAGLKAELPLPTRMLIASSNFSVEYWPYILTAAVAAIFAFRAWARTEKGSLIWGRLKLRMPVIGDILMRATLGRFARSFAMSMRSGVPLIQALTVVARAVDNRFVESRILLMRNGLERGESLSKTAVASGLFTPLVLQMLAVGEETGAVDEMMDEVAGFYEREVDYDLKNLSDAIEPIMLLAIGGMVLILALGVFLPMWELSSAAGLK